ncbi:MAG: hypothetical protein P8181_15365, partial [bacterium]
MSKTRRERRRAERDQSRGKVKTSGPVWGGWGRVSRREWIALGLILLFGLALRVTYLSEIKNAPAFAYPAYDAAYHDYWARAIDSGDWSPPKFHQDPKIDELPFFRPPGYPYFLAGVYAITGGSYLGARLLQM